MEGVRPGVASLRFEQATEVMPGLLAAYVGSKGRVFVWTPVAC